MLLPLLPLSSFLLAQTVAAGPEQEIRAVLDRQVAAWNANRLPEFVGYYEDSPQTTFVGSEVSRGLAGLLDRYQKKYPTPEKMGVLEFSELEIRMLGPDYASVLGRFHLTRTQAAGGDARGIFTLVLHRTGKEWKVILDHTS